MNDLAEKALRGAAVARRKVGEWALPEFGVLGFALGCVVVVAGGRVVAASPTTTLTTWFGLEDWHGLRDTWVPATIMLTSIAGLVVLWVCAASYLRHHRGSLGPVWWLAGAWGLPFALGPPLMDTALYSYAGFGLLQRQGLDPYRFGVSRLGDHAVIAAVEPAARGTASAVGPLGTLLQHLAVSVAAGSALGAVIVLRVVAVVATVFIGRLAADLAGSRRCGALAMTILNPLVLLYLVSAAHLDAVMIALVLAALVRARQRHWPAAVVFACLAGSVSGQGFIVAVVIIAAHLAGRRGVPAWRVLLTDATAAAAVTIGAALLVPHGFGWLWTVRDQFSAHTPYSISGALVLIMSAVVRAASYDDLAAGARTAVVVAAVVAVAWVVATVRRRPVERSAGYALLAIALLAPVLFPWYVLWGALCLAPTASGTRRVAVLGLCASACLLLPPGFTKITQEVLTGVALSATLLTTTLVVRARRRRATAEPAVSAGS